MSFRYYFLARFVLLAVAMLASVITAAAQSGRAKPTPTPPDDDPVKIVTEEVKVNLLAFDAEGKFVSDVVATDLVVNENNILHQATSVRRIPANVLIVMDTGGELRSVKTLDQTRKVARGVLSGLKSDDSIAVLQYGDRAEIVAEWTTDKELVSAAIGRAKFGRRSVFVDALKLATEFLSANGLENKHLVLITDGTDSAADISKKNAAMRKILSTDIAVHIISYTRMEAVDIEPRTKMITNSPPPQAMPDEVKAGLPPGVRDVAQSPKIGPTINMDRTLIKRMKARKAELELSEEMLETLAENTNGTIIVPDTLEEMVEKTAVVAKMIDATYVLTYTPKIPFSEKPGERKIEVTSKRPGLVVQAKRKLIVPGRG